MRPLPPIAVKLLVLLGVACLGVVTLVGLRLHDVRGPVSLDVRTARPVFDHIFGIPVVPTRLARGFQELGNPPQFALILAALVGAGILLHDRLVAWSAGIGPVVAEILAEKIGKPLFNRTDYAGVDSFPSGHVTAMTAIAAIIVLLAYRRWGVRGLTWGVPLGALLSGSMLLSVVRLHSHVMSDALGGIGVGLGAVALVVAVVDVTISTGEGSSDQGRSSVNPAAEKSPSKASVH